MCYEEVSAGESTSHEHTNCFSMVYLTVASDSLEQQVFGMFVG